MEKTTHLNGSQSLPVPEAFIINDGATGKSFAIRDATDEQLQQAIQSAQVQANQLHQDSMRALGAAQNILAGLAVFNYELDRRKRSITIVASLPRAN